MNKIMVVEDEAVIAIRLQERLTAMGYHVVGISYSGEDAMEQARRLRPDLILMDIMIPGEMDGIAVAKLVKTELDIPVIFLTAFSEDKIIDRAKQAEPYGYIVKPFQDRELKACVEIALYKKEMGKALQEAHNELELRVKERTRDLEIKTKSLEEMNIAMKILLKKREEDKIELEDNVLTNVKELVMPFVDKFRKTQLDEQQKTFLSIIESNLNEIISPFTRRLSLEYLRLTPSEIQIANMTKHGNTSKKIAKIMNISPRTVDTHKKNIRRKIGLEGKRANLRSYLLSLH
ncbi:MAG: response regulator transcription factor [Deltaproteobacteria bacterium]|nr:response regulator transcription factor [Deltaproteobacteria bacterium]MBW2571650.1 response regulator transcription factor [Deltaproteobacteria bacterium]MBW2669144.1 response regulator transcription factor [Deltaproteobacteria bacterium]